MKKVYKYRCYAGHEVEFDRPFHYAVVGCQAIVPASFNRYDYRTCGLWCWPIED